MYLALSYVEVKPSTVDEYVAARRELINPALEGVPGYVASVLLRPRTDEGSLRMALLNSWNSREEQRRFAATALYSDLHDQTDHLVEGIEYRIYQRLDDPSIQVAEPATAGMWSIGTHEVQPGRGPEYLANRRDIGNADMKKAPGFVGLAVHADPDDDNKFLNVFQWGSDAQADTYYASDSHMGEVYAAIAGPLTGPPLPTPRYDLVLAHSA